MTKREIFLLLSPTLLFATIVVASFFMSHTVREATRDNGHRQKFETFISNVQNGKWQVTTDKWVVGMREEEATAQEYRTAAASTSTIFRDFILAGVLGIVFQAAVVLSVLKRFKKTMTNKTHR